MNQLHFPIAAITDEFSPDFFDLTVIDIPELVSNANESLEWETNPDICPAKGTGSVTVQ